MQYIELKNIMKCVAKVLTQSKKVQKQDLISSLQEQGHFAGALGLAYKCVEYLKFRKWIKVYHATHGYLKLTEQGKQYLEKPEEQWLPLRYLESIYLPYRLLMNLKLVRNQIAEERNLKPYEVCTNYMLEKMAFYQPKDVEELLKISGFKEWKGDAQWHRYLLVIKEWKASEAEKETAISPNQAV